MKKLTPVPSTPDDIDLLLHEAVVYGEVFDPKRFGAKPPAPLYAFVVGRRMPTHSTTHEQLQRVHAERARRFAVWRDEDGARFVVEVDAAAVVPFVTRERILQMADDRANAAQRARDHGASRGGCAQPAIDVTLHLPAARARRRR